MVKYVLGIDGGNTKTDYILYTTDGRFAGLKRMPTCSHEQLPGGFDDVRVTLSRHLEELYSLWGFTVKDLECAAFGLAGCDTQTQQKILLDIILSLGFKDAVVANDGILGIKAVSPDGTGVCAINGAGTVIAGIDAKGRTMQVGGLGMMTDDRAGGGYITRKAVAAVYAYHFRNGPARVLTEPVLKAMNLPAPADLHEAISRPETYKSSMDNVNRAVDETAIKGDKTARDLFHEAGINVADGVTGLIKAMDLKEPVRIVLGGSMWSEIKYTGLISSFKERISADSEITLLNAPPAVGAVIWALQRVSPDEPDRKAVLDFLTRDRYKTLIKKDGLP